MAREVILGTCHVFDYVVVGGALKHPEEGQIVDLSHSIFLNDISLLLLYLTLF